MSEERTLEFMVSLVTGISTVIIMLYMAIMLSGLYGGRVIADTELTRKIEEGKAFTSSKRFTLDSGQTVQIVFNNKSDKRIKVVAIEVNTEGNVDIDVYDNVSIDSSGNSWTIRNLNLGSDYMTAAEVEDGGTYSGGEPVHETVGYGGAKNFAVGSLSEVGEEVIVPPNKNIMIAITNSTTQSFKVSVRFLFYEAD